MKEKCPNIGNEYHFFDDGKINESRHHIAKVVGIITPEQAKDVVLNRPWYDAVSNKVKYKPTSLYDIWRKEIDDYRQGVNFKVLSGGSTEVGAPWLYSEETDFFIKCSIPTYDDKDVWFVRTIVGEWFSMDTEGSWMSGLLDVSGKLYEGMI